MSPVPARMAKRHLARRASAGQCRPRRTAAHVVILLLIHSALLAGRQPPPKVVEALISNAQPKIAEPVTLRIDLSGIDGGTRLSPSVGPELGPFQVLAVRRPGQRQSAQEQSQPAWEIVVSTLESGKLQLPAIRFEEAGPDRRTITGAETKPITIDVTSPDVDLKGGLKPLKPPIERSLGAMIVAVAGLGVLGAVGVGALAVDLWRYLRKKVHATHAGRRDPAEVLLASLEALRTMPATTEEQRRAIRARMFHGVRQLLHSWFGVGAEGLSSPELVSASARHGCSDGVAHSLGLALGQIDEARFAKRLQATDELSSLIGRTLGAVGSMRREIEHTGRRKS